MVGKHGPQFFDTCPIDRRDLCPLPFLIWLSPWSVQPTKYDRSVNMQLPRLCRFPPRILLGGSFSRNQPTACKKPKGEKRHLVYSPSWDGPLTPPSPGITCEWSSLPMMAAPRCSSLPSWGPRPCGAKTSHPCCAYLSSRPRISEHLWLLFHTTKCEVVYCFWWLEHFYSHSDGVPSLFIESPTSMGERICSFKATGFAVKTILIVNLFFPLCTHFLNDSSSPIFSK